MPTTTIYSESNDGHVNTSGSNWVSIRDNVNGTGYDRTGTTGAYSIRASDSSGRGSTTYFISRAFFEFDVSDINHLPKSGTLQIYGSNFGNSSVEAIKGTQSNPLGLSDFDSIEGWDGSSSDGAAAGDNRLNVTDYGTSHISSWSTSGYNTFTLTQQALVDIAGSDLLKVCLIDPDYDLRDITPSGLSTNYSGVRYSEYGSTSSDPKLVIEEQDSSVFFGTNF